MRQIACLLALFSLVGCAGTQSAARAPLVASETTVRPLAQAVLPASRGSLVPAAQINQAGVRGLFEERRASRVGDTLTVVLNETTRASKDGGTSASRLAANTATLGFKTGRTVAGTTATNRQTDASLGLSSNGNANFDSKGGASASNQFSGTITVTVLDVLSNGNLAVAGEKRLAVGAEEEIIRFAGVVNPTDLNGNTVSSTLVADARIEYRGRVLELDVLARPGDRCHGVIAGQRQELARRHLADDAT